MTRANNIPSISFSICNEVYTYLVASVDPSRKAPSLLELNHGSSADSLLGKHSRDDESKVLVPFIGKTPKYFTKLVHYNTPAIAKLGRTIGDHRIVYFKQNHGNLCNSVTVMLLFYAEHPRHDGLSCHDRFLKDEVLEHRVVPQQSNELRCPTCRCDFLFQCVVVDNTYKSSCKHPIPLNL